MDSAVNLIDEIKALAAGERETGADDPIGARGGDASQERLTLACRPRE
jgi:hypothetical protein